MSFFRTRMSTAADMPALQSYVDNGGTLVFGCWSGYPYSLVLEQMPKEISKWPRRNGLYARKRQRPMSIDLGLVPLTPQTGHCAQAASQAVLKELLGKGLARGWGEGAPSPSRVSGCVASAGQALWELTCLRALPETSRRCHHFGNLFRYLALSRKIRNDHSLQRGIITVAG